MENNNYLKETKQRITTVRARTWTLTGAIVVALVVYLLVNVTTRTEVDWVSFLLVASIQIVVYTIYFPDGELFGQKNKTFISNKTAYNEKATAINQNKLGGKLREYCKHEYEVRKRRYFLNEIGKIGITEEEFIELSQMPEKEMKKLKTYEIKEVVNGEEKSRFINFSKYKRKILCNLCFKEYPIQQNYPETIMSATENDGSSSIQDSSISYKRHAYMKKILWAVVVGGVFAYIGYTAKDGIGLPELVAITTYLTTLFTTAVMAFSSGENCSKVYKSHFYLDLSQFIDDFNEWNSKQPQVLTEKKE